MPVIQMTDYNRDNRELNRFMRSPVGKKMPRMLVDEVLRGFDYANARFITGHMALVEVRTFGGKEIADRVATEGNPNVPIVRNQHDPTQYVYHPSTGRYLGAFNTE